MVFKEDLQLDRIEQLLEETDPQKLIKAANEVLSNVKNITPTLGGEGQIELLRLIFSAATFYQTRATYLLLSSRES